MRSDANESETVREEEEEEEEVAMGVCDSLDCETMDGVNCGVLGLWLIVFMGQKRLELRWKWEEE